MMKIKIKKEKTKIFYHKWEIIKKMMNSMPLTQKVNSTILVKMSFKLRNNNNNNNNNNIDYRIENSNGFITLSNKK